MAPGSNDNPLLQETPLPRFDAIAPEQIEPAISRLIAEQRARVIVADRHLSSRRDDGYGYRC